MDTKILRVNLLVLLGYAVLIQLGSLLEPKGASMVVLILMMVAVGGHVGILLIGAVVKFATGQGTSATQWLLCAVIVGLVGFGTCWGGATLADLYSGPMSFQ